MTRRLILLTVAAISLICLPGVPGINPAYVTAEVPSCWDCLTQCNGDTDCDGDADTTDWPVFRDSFGKEYPSPEYQPCGDMDHDGDVDTEDWPAFRDNFGDVVPADCAGGGVWPPGSGTLLADNGQALLPIVIRSTREDFYWGAGCSTTGEKQVAFELADILGRMTGATFEVLVDGLEYVVLASDSTPVYDLATVGGLAMDLNDNILVGEDGSPGTYTIFENNAGAGQAIIPLQTTGGLQYPQGIDVHSDGTVAVAVKTNSGSGEIQFYSSGGSFLSSFSVGAYGGCSGVAFDAAGDVWVTSETTFGVRRFRQSDGALLQQVTTTPGLNRTFMFNVRGVEVDAAGRVYVADYCRVIRFDPADPSGTMELFAGLPGFGFPTGSGEGEFGPNLGGLDIDTAGNVYVADKENHRIQVFDSTGAFVKIIGDNIVLYGTDVGVDSAGDVYGFDEDTVNDEYSLIKLFANTAQATNEGIFVGTLDDFPEFGVADPSIEPALEIRGKYYDGMGSYVIRTEPNQVLILGRTALGVSHGVSGFLQELGYRLFFPGENWEHVPSLPTLSVNLNMDERPDYLSFQANYGYGFFQSDKCEADYHEWSRRNRKGMSLPYYTGHAWQNVVYANQAVFDAHPEYFALVNGVRKTTEPYGFCVSNPAVIQLCKDWARDYLTDNPDEKMVAMEPSDLAPMCECGAADPGGGNCDAISGNPTENTSHSDITFSLVNEVAQDIAIFDPCRLVGALAYHLHSDIPSFPLEDNIYIQLCRIWIWGEHRYDELVELWPQVAGGLGFYGYWSIFTWNMDILPTRYVTDASYLEKHFRWWYDTSQEGLSINPEIDNSWGPHGRGYYLGSRLRWYAYDDVDAILADFYTKMYGPAAATMQSFYERIDFGNVIVFDDQEVAKIFRDIETATTQAAGDPDVLKRLEDLKIYLRYYHLNWLRTHATVYQEKEDASLAMATLGYRARHRYMFDWAWLGQWWIWKIYTWDPTGTVGDPVTWNYNYPAAPWRDETPISSAEVDAWFQDGLAYFQVDPCIIELTFSDDVVPVQFANYNPGAEMWAQWNGSGIAGEELRYATYSLTGEDLQFDIITAFYHPTMPPLYYRVEDPCGNLIDDGTLPMIQGVRQPVSVSVPGPGLYYLQVEDNSAGWAIRAQFDMPLSVEIRGMNGGHNHQGGQLWYFYVPAGTETVYLYPGNDYTPGAAGYYVDLRGPNGEYITTVYQDGVIKAIPVPPGLDGKAWHLGEGGDYPGFQPNSFYLYNVPRWLSSTPNALMVPRDIAISDGLNIRP